ncbi:7-cyano-7-deazaguanine synthase QueC [Mesorhizobium ciceri]|uniref:7-cyano-7-deazaguanine synthase QueC n=1 Tax=Mesorhizobium TaxID=68287 RepID=UPI0007A94F2E|nr:7-cyano-7-deazaguanine synthase QueC [Mesorhizobium ciceri]AMX99029.1 7-cyano-7-deazaguanine synthase [Mesorhizobium ciceri biovar biserrulae]
MKTLVVCSGGLDSVSLAHKVASEHELTGLLSFDYGQRHRQELRFATLCAERLNVAHQIIDIRQIGRGLRGSALTDSVDVPDGHYAEDTMKITVVPNRNAIMLAIAFGLAAAHKAEAVAMAAHGGDHFIYPDCRPAFIEAFQTMQDRALDGDAQIRLYTPYVNLTKADIVGDGAGYGTPFAQTWSCYKGGERHCGRCGTCVERREAFHLAQHTDPTEYEDTDFWLEALRRRSA